MTDQVTQPAPESDLPHLVIELTNNVRLACSPTELLKRANQVLLSSGQFQEPDIKARCIPVDVFHQGVESAERAFVHARLSILDGRDLETRRALGQAVCEVIAKAIDASGDGPVVQVSVEVVEMERASYAKKLITG